MHMKSIAWTNVDSSWKVFCGIHLRAVAQDALMKLIHNMFWKLYFYIYYHISQGQMS